VETRQDQPEVPTEPGGAAANGAPSGRTPANRTLGGGPPGGAVKDFVAGMGLLGRGLGMYARNPRLLALGLIPAVISMLLIATAFGVLLYFITDLAALVTWFADDWSAGLRGTVRLLAGVAIVGVAALLAIIAYTALTLIIGDPFYEAISKRVEQQFGAAPDEPSIPWWVSARYNLVDSVRLLAFSIVIGIPMFAAGFIPVVGQIAVPVLDAIIGGWLLVIELTGIPFNRRGLRLRDRRQLLRANRALALGFGVPVFVIFLIPFAAVLVIPAAVAGSTLLTRRVLGLPYR
jgi:CysZ protein